jgi:hypothetical protein
VHNRLIPGRFNSFEGKLVFGALEFLQADDVGLSAFQPGKEPFLSGADRVEVPGGKQHMLTSDSGGIDANRVWRGDYGGELLEAQLRFVGPRSSVN